jgi:hypothetical protein
VTRRRLLLALGVALPVAAGAVWRFMPRQPPTPGISEANCARIKPGMRKEQVEDILGGPPGIYGGGRLVDPEESLDTGRAVLSEWVNEAGTVHVWFDHDGTVVGNARYFNDMPSAH